MVPRPTIASHGRAVVEAIDQADRDGDPLYTVTEVGATLRLPRVSVVRRCRSGAIPAIRIEDGARGPGGTLLIRDSDLRAYLRRAGWR